LPFQGAAAGLNPDRARPCILYGLASSRDLTVRYIGQTRDGAEQAWREHRADAAKKADLREFDCSDWIRREVSAGFRIKFVPIATEGAPVWDVSLRAEVARRKLRGEQLLNRPPDHEAIPREAPVVPITDSARQNMRNAAKRRFELQAGTRA
jgi:hypothetical protein